eukprot:TRINITY_DN4880_c0_g1_i1.p1 TRINITY_DN4880_c0_g1~~TRINITY_DN4880_c0_g1_i1.p1  ORF type:complete len:627 (+),score=171.12 TRINITY_DN4880_c0_g1_i1:253-1881(+)
MEKSPSEIGDKGGLIVMYFKDAKKKEKSEIKLLVCGDDWPAPEKLSEYLMVTVQKDKKLEDVIPDLQKVLKVTCFDGYDICKGRGKAPKITPGAILPLSQSPSELNLSAAALIYVKKRKSAEDKKAGKEEPKHKTIYQLGARVEVLDDDIDEWLPGNISFIREDGTYDVTLDKGGVESHTDVDDIRECSKPAAKPKKAPLTREEQRTALFTLMEEFEDKSAPEIGGCLKQVGFDITEARRILSAQRVEAEKVAAAKKAAKKAKEDKERAANPSKVGAGCKEHSIEMKESSEQLGLSFHAIGGKVFVDECDDGFPFARANVSAPSILTKIDGKKVETREDVLNIVTKLKSSGVLKFKVEIDSRKESQLWMGAPVEVDIEREWEKGTIIAIHENGTFDIQLTSDEEIERDIEFDDIRLRKDDIKEASPSGNNTSGPAPLPPATMPDHEGVMKKQGADIVGLYKLRRFALYDQALYYFHTNSNKPLGVLDLKGSLAMSDPKRGKEWFAIGSKILPRVYNFICGSEEEMEDWLVKLEQNGCVVKRK